MLHIIQYVQWEKLSHLTLQPSNYPKSLFPVSRINRLSNHEVIVQHQVAISVNSSELDRDRCSEFSAFDVHPDKHACAFLNACIVVSTIPGFSNTVVYTKSHMRLLSSQ